MPLLNEEFFVGTLERKSNYHTNGQKHDKTNICLVISQKSCRLKVKRNMSTGGDFRLAVVSRTECKHRRL